jgi:hypothetical protein
LSDRKVESVESLAAEAPVDDAGSARGGAFAGGPQAAQFRAAYDRYLIDISQLPGNARLDDRSLGKVVADRAHGLAEEFQKDQKYVSKLLEQATRTGDSMHLMRAMLALHDYQVRVQAMSKTISKAAGAIDQLTKMQ